MPFSAPLRVLRGQRCKAVLRALPGQKELQLPSSAPLRVLRGQRCKAVLRALRGQKELQLPFSAPLRVLRGQRCKAVLRALPGQKELQLPFSAPLRVLRGQKGVKQFPAPSADKRSCSCPSPRPSASSAEKRCKGVLRAPPRTSTTSRGNTSPRDSVSSEKEVCAISDRDRPTDECRLLDHSLTET